MNYLNYIKAYLNEVKNICDSIDENSIESFIKSIQDLKERNGRLFILGVGGSAANASHAVNDFRKILNIETYAVTDNSSELTARINDDGWETSYLNWLKVSKFSKNDAILIFSVGGGSDSVSLNLVRSMEYAKEIGADILSVVSRNGGKAKELSNSCILIPVIDETRITPHAEEWQGIILHLVVNALT
jgi:D-sedoheptulose 7-phosphate isomerase